MKSLKAAIDELHSRHADYIQSTYHIRHPRLIKERQAILHADYGIRGEPWLEGTPSYESDERIDELGLPAPVEKVLLNFAESKLGVYPTPYTHQSRGLQAFFNDEKDLVVATGTGSGKTEIFLYSILGQLALEGQRGRTAGHRGMRTIILYPMNALVSDQLARLRKFIGGPVSSTLLRNAFGRTVQFGMYTSRTPYPGRFDVKKNRARLQDVVSYYVELEKSQPGLYRDLLERGRIPAKELRGFLGKRGQGTKRYRTQPGDAELLTRQEMHDPSNLLDGVNHGGTPDILITNYSMLEYMLLRPIEQPLFDSTKDWLQADPANQLTIVVDEAHLYRGAQGAEIAMLIRRLIQRLGISRDRVRFILTSASLGKDANKVGPAFASDLTAGEPDSFAVIEGSRKLLRLGTKIPIELANALLPVDKELSGASCAPLAEYLGIEHLPDDDVALRKALATALKEAPGFAALHDILAKSPAPLSRLATELIQEMEPELARQAILNFALVASGAQKEDGAPLLPIRLHLMYRGLPRQYICTNSLCGGRAEKKDPAFLGAMFLSPRNTCPHCDARVFELYTHRTCGAPYLRAFYHPRDDSRHRFLWTEADPKANLGLRELHLLLEEPRHDEDKLEKERTPLAETIAPSYLDTRTGYLEAEASPTEPSRYLKCWYPPTQGTQKGKKKKDKEIIQRADSWTRCYACGIKEKLGSDGTTEVMDLETKGEQPFANIVKTLFDVQPPTKKLDRDAINFPNLGKKVLCFSDGRQKAARLARDLQRAVGQDAFREILILTAADKGNELTLDKLFPHLIVETRKHNIVLFDDGDRSVAGGPYPGSRTRFLEAQGVIDRLLESAKNMGLETSVEELLEDEQTREDIEANKPRQYEQALLRMFGDRNFSIRASLIGYVAPIPKLISTLEKVNSGIPKALLNEIINACIEKALDIRAFDPEISDFDRRESRTTNNRPGWARRPHEGLSVDELIPDELEPVLRTLDPSAVSRLRECLRGVPGVPALFRMKNDRLHLNPSVLYLEIGVKKPWKICSGCKQFAVTGLQGVCPDATCGGVLRDIPEDDLYVSTWRSFLRSPARAVAERRRTPFTLRSEEHTAQLTTKDKAEVFGRAEKYELLFQDVLIHDASRQEPDDEDGAEVRLRRVEQPVDVLSCTTTMEVGIDIGSLTAVALRTVPPRADNYQQRSGRAGRRGSALSIIVTFADNSPHETYVFNNPGALIGADAGEPTVYVGNAKIAQRHLNASLLQLFFQRFGYRALSEGSHHNVFESLGSTAEFFGGDGPYSFAAFKVWLPSEMKEGRAADRLAELLPPALRIALQAKESDWARRFVVDAAADFLEGLQHVHDKGEWSVEADDENNLLNALLDNALLPTFSFPIDLATFAVRDLDDSKMRVTTKYEMTQGLSQALSEYIPGREIVVDKHTFISYGLHIPFSENEVNRAEDEGWVDLPWLNHCRECGTVIDITDKPLGGKDADTPMECPLCASALQSIRRYKPKGFSPAVDFYKGTREGGQETEERVYATSAQFPTPPESIPAQGVPIKNVSTVAEVRKKADQHLIVANLGVTDEDSETEADHGFSVCTSCGAVGGADGLRQAHHRPYPIDFRHRKEAGPACNGSPIRVAFAYQFNTDLAILRVDFRPPMNFAHKQPWFKATCQSLAEALLLATTRSLGIDSTEIAGGYRPVRRAANAEDVDGHVEFFLYDTTAGGAGFAAKAAENFDLVLEQAAHLLANCDCETSCNKCLRTYKNRLHHRSLDRYDASALLHYIRTGQPPSVDSDRARRLIAILSATLKLASPKATVERTSEGTATVKLGTKVTKVRIHSVVVSEDHEMTDAHGSVTRSDYDVLHKLPEVVNTITSGLSE